jgi:5-methylcytosine-specific restriction protein A
MALADITRSGVEAALAEAEVMGLEAFLKEYDFGPAKRHWLVHDGKRYPSKAIAGVAHKAVDGVALKGSSTFKGGDSSVAKKLRSLGFTVEAIGRNPAWTDDELILAIDLYFLKSDSLPGKGSEPVAALSRLLNHMRTLSGVQGVETYRNPDGVYLKLMNLRALDPAYTSQGKVGMTSGGAREKVLWSAYCANLEDLRRDAQSIRDAIEKLEAPSIQAVDAPPPYEGEEGGVIMTTHKRYERDPKLIREKRKAAQEAGALRCEVCTFDFSKAYDVVRLAE